MIAAEIAIGWVLGHGNSWCSVMWAKAHWDKTGIF